MKLSKCFFGTVVALIIFINFAATFTYSKSGSSLNNENENSKVQSLNNKKSLKYANDLYLKYNSKEQIRNNEERKNKSRRKKKLSLNSKNMKSKGAGTSDQIKKKILAELTDLKSRKGQKDSCLIKEETILELYKAEVAKLDASSKVKVLKHLRFLHGPCSPTIIIPGLFATRLQVVINCKELKAELGDELKFYCGNAICSKDNQSTYDFWTNVYAGGFFLSLQDDNVNSSCMAFFFKFYNKNDSCGKKLCRYSDNIRFVPFGAQNTKEDEAGSADFNCGFGGVNNIANLGVLKKVQSQPPVTQGFLKIYEKLTDMGLQSGLSLAAVPYDWKESHCKNKQFSETFKKIVDLLYEKVGKQKKITIIAHSYGNLNFMQQIYSNPELKEKIGHYIPLAPAFGGAPKGDLLVSNGSTEFINTVKLGVTTFIFDFTRFGMSIAFPYVPSGNELRVINVVETLKMNKNTAVVAIANKLLAFQLYEKCVMENDGDVTKCVTDDMTKKNIVHPVQDILGEDFKWIADKEFCSFSKEAFTQNLSKDFDKFNDDDNANIPLSDPCLFKSFDYSSCATIKVKETDDKITQASKDKTLLSILCKNSDKHFFPTDCTNQDKQCTTKYLKDFTIKPIQYEESLLKLCKKRNSKNDTLALCKESLPSNFLKEYQNFMVSQTATNFEQMCSSGTDGKRARRIADPQIPVTLIYNKSFQTRAAFLFDDNRETINPGPQKRIQTFFSGGDGTLPGDAALFPVLSWTATNPNIKILDYCSPVQPNSKYHYKGADDIFVGQEKYKFLNCKCVQSNGYYDAKMEGKCAHAEMLGDENIINVIADIVSGDPKNAIEVNDDLKGKLVEDLSSPIILGGCKKIFTDIYLQGFTIVAEKKGWFNKKKTKLRREQGGSGPVASTEEEEEGFKPISDTQIEELKKELEKQKKTNLLDAKVKP